MSRQPPAAKTTEPGDNPQSPGSALPAHYTPGVATYAAGPFVEPKTVTPTSWRWRRARTYIVQAKDGHAYRCLRVRSGDEFVGYWAVERLGALRPAPGLE